MKRTLLFIFLLLFLGLITATAFLRYGDIGERFRVKAVEEITAELRHPVEIDRLIVNIFPGWVTVRGVRVKGADGRPLVEVRQVRGYLSWADVLFHKKIDIRRITVDAPAVSIARIEGGDYTITPLIDDIRRLIEEPTHIPYRINLREVHVAEGTIHYEDEAAGVKGRMGKIGGSFLARGEEHIFSVTAGEGSVRKSEAGEVPFLLRSAFKLTPDRVRLDSLVVESKGSRLDLLGTLTEGDGGMRFDGEAGLAVIFEDWHETIFASRGVGGKMKVKSKVAGPLHAIAAEGRATGDIVLGDPLFDAKLPVSSIDTKFTADGGGITLSGLFANVVGGRWKGDAQIIKNGKGGWSYRLAGALEQGNLKVLQDLFVKERYVTGGTVTGSIEAAGVVGDASSLRGKGDFTAKPVPVQAEGMTGTLISGIKEVKGGVTFGPEGVELTKGTVDSSLYSLSVSGGMGDEKLDLDIACTVPQVAPLIPKARFSRITGRGEAVGRITGTIDEPVFAGRVTVTDALWNGVPVASASGDMDVSKKQLSSPGISLIQGKGRYLLSGNIKFGEEVFYDARLVVKGGDPRQVARIFYEDLPLSMSASGEMTFKGTADSFIGGGALESPGGSAWGHAFDHASVQAKLMTDKITFPAFSIRRSGGKASGSGEIDWTGGYAVAMKATGVDLAALGLLDREVPLQAAFSVKADGRGTFEKPRFEVSAETPDVRYKSVALGRGRMNGVMENGRFSGSFMFPDQRIEGKGEAELAKKQAWSFDARLKESRLDPFLLLLGEKAAGISVTAGGRVAAAGEGKNLETLRGMIDLSPVKAVVHGHEVQSDGSLRLAVNGDKVTIGNLQLKGKGTSLDAVGDLRLGHSYNILLRGSADMGLLRTFSDRIEGASGSAGVVLAVDGPWTDPDTTGIFHVDGGQIKLKDVRYRLTDMDAVFIFSRDEVVLQSFKATSSGGTLTGSGQIHLAHFKPETIFLALAVEGFRFRHEDALTAVAGGRLNYEKTPKGQLISGDVGIANARYTKRVDWKSALAEGKGKGGIPALSANVPVIGDAALNVHIFGDEKFVIDNNIARIPVTVDLYLRGTVNRPQVLGRLEATKGSVFFRGADYKILSAIIEFSDPERISPSFNISTETAVRDYKVTMNLAGTLDRFSADLQSDPPLADIDVIGLLTVGRTGAELQQGAEGGMAAGEAVSFITGQIQDVMEERVKSITGFDRFQIDPYAGGIQSSGGARVTVGKRLLSERLLVTYTANIGSTEEQVLTVEYKLAKNLSLVGKKDERGFVKADIRYRFEFR